jgi:hypothetical protein|tara:strand:+ start:532 stop:2493 length:1962 start_codon:yes stop_codon:yes gene_type:complete
MDGLSNLIDKLNPALLQKLGKNESPYYDARPFMVPRDEEGNIIPFEQPDPKPFMVPRDEEGNIIPFDPKEGIQLLSSEEDLLQLLDSEEKEEKFEINGIPTTEEGVTAYTEKFLDLNDEGKKMFYLYKEKYPDKDINVVLDVILSKPEFVRTDMIEEEKQIRQKATGGIMRLRGGGPPGSGSGANKDFKGSYKTGSKSTDRNTGNNQGNQESRQNTANELDQLMSSSGLERILQNKTNTSSVDRVIQDMPQKFQDFVERNTKNGKMNAAAKSIFNRYNDGRTDNQRDINAFRKASDFNNQAYKERFPNPLINIARGIGDVYSKFSPMANIARALNAGNNKVKNFGPVKDATNTAKNLAGMFGLDGLMGKLVNIAGGRDNNQFNEVIKNNQTSTAMRNNLAYNDPRGLNNAPIYRDPIMDMALPNIDTSMEDQYRQFGSIMDKRKSIEKTMGFDTSGIDDSYIDRIYNSSNIQDRMNSVGDDKEEIENSLLPGQFNFNTNSGINLGGDPDEVFEDVSETEYVNPNDVINQENMISPNVFSNTPLIDPSGVYTDGTPMYNDTGELDQDSLDILNSNSTEIPNYIRFGRADGGYMNGFPNQNTGAPSVTASDNIDNRIMQNLQFEQMAPGMMGYNQGGKVMSTYDKLKAIADNNYG